MTYLPLEARLALEWMSASGEKSMDRVTRLVEHFCTTNGIHDRETRDAVLAAAFKAAGY